MALYRVCLASTLYHYVDVYADDEDTAYEIGVDRIVSGDEDDRDEGEFWDEAEVDLLDENATDPVVVNKEEPDLVY